MVFLCRTQTRRSGDRTKEESVCPCNLSCVDLLYTDTPENDCGFSQLFQMRLFFQMYKHQGVLKYTECKTLRERVSENEEFDANSLQTIRRGSPHACESYLSCLLICQQIIVLLGGR